MSDTILNMNIPLGSYAAYLVMDVKANGQLELASVCGYDMVDFKVTP